MKLSEWKAKGGAGRDGESWAIVVSAEALESLFPNEDPPVVGKVERHGITPTVRLWAALSTGLGSVVTTSDPKEQGASPITATVVPWTNAPVITLVAQGHTEDRPVSLRIAGEKLDNRRDEEAFITFFSAVAAKLNRA